MSCELGPERFHNNYNEYLLKKNNKSTKIHINYKGIKYIVQVNIMSYQLIKQLNSK
jgi:hypothetical protein